MKKTLLVTLILLLPQIYAQEILDIKVDIIEKEILPDDPLRFQVTIFRLGQRREDIYFQYFIGNEESLKFIKSESIAIEKIGSFFRTIELPSNIKVGQNTLFIKASINKNELGQATANFNILKSKEYAQIPKNYLNYIFIILAIILITFTIFMIWDYQLTYKLIKSYKKIGEKDL